MTERRVRVFDRETHEHLRVRLRREHLAQALHAMMTRLDEYRDDPAVMLLIRCGAFTLELFSTHPVDKRGRCTRRNCRRLLGLSRRVCPTLGGLMFYSHADVATVCWRVLTESAGKGMPLSSVRHWLEERGPTPGGGSHP